MSEKLDPCELIHKLIETCTRADDVAFWILTSAMFHLEGGTDNEGSTAAALFWDVR